MNLEKYKKLLLNNIRKQLMDWFENNNQASIPNDEVYRFLHSIKGTSGTVQLDEIFEITSKLILEVDKEEEKNWLSSELSEYLYPLLQLSYEYEHFNELEVEELKPAIERDDKAPLIYIIDDDVSMLIQLKDVLEKQGWMVLTNSDPVKATNQYFDLLPDFLIIGLEMSTRNGSELLQDIHAHTQKQFVPKVIISANQDRNERIASYKMGADDFIEKPFDLEELIVRIARLIQKKQLFDQSIMIDELTQVYNRKLLPEVYQRRLERFSRKKEPFTLVIIDIDHFKIINDTYGHTVGDKVLSHFAQFLTKNVRSADTVIRFGGEEFVILFADCPHQQVKEKLEEMIVDYAAIIHDEQEQSFFVTFSAGMFSIYQEKVELLEALEKADQALYRAKEKGRARVEIGEECLLDYTKKKLYISVIDDDVIIRTILIKILKTIKLSRIELDIEVFEDGSKFFEKGRHNIEGSHFVILDGVMPVMDGLEVLQKLKGLKQADHFNVLMLTSRKSETDIARALSLGADDYLTKPFNIMELQARIQRLLQGIK